MAVSSNKTKKKLTVTGMIDELKSGGKVSAVWGRVDISEEGIRKESENLGKLSGLTQFPDPAFSKGKGFGFVEFAGMSAAGYLGGAKALAIKNYPDTEEEYISLIRRGISKRSVEHLMQAANISVGEMAEIMELKPKVFAALKPTAMLEKSQSEKAVNIARLYAMGEEVFGSAAEFDKWMTGRVPSLGKKRPKDFLDTASGIGLLMDELGRIQHGVYS